MSEGWPLVPLGEVLTKSEDWIVPIPDRSYKEVTIRLWGKGVTERREALGAEIGEARRLRVRRCQFILSRIDARNGAFGLVPDFLDGAVVSNDFPSFALNLERILPSFLEWMSKTHGFVDLCKAASEGTTNRVRLKEDQFLAMQVPLPPLPEQRRIVGRIEELAGKIEEARRLRREAVEEVEAFTLSLHLELSGTGRVCIADILQLHEDKAVVLSGRSYPQVGVKGFGQGLFARETLEAHQTTYKNFNRLYAGAVILSQVKAWEGAVAVCPTGLAGLFVSPEYRTFQCIPNKAEPEYLSAIITTPWFWNRLKNATRGVGARRERTRPEQFLRIEIPMPTCEQQIKAIDLFRQTDALRVLQGETEKELAALLPSVLDRAFSGRL